MLKKLPFLLCGALLLAPVAAQAHDPLDDVSGEDDLNNPGKDTEKPTSHKKERQEAELAKEVQERDETEFHLNSEKDEFLRDRGETKDVLDAQRRRNQLSGAARGHHDDDGPPPVAAPKHEVKDPPPPTPAAKPKDDTSNRGDVDPTEVGDDVKPVTSDGEPPPPTPGKKKKKP